MRQETGEVIKRNMSHNSLFFVFFGTLLGTFVLGYVSKLLGGNLPFIDALSTTVSIVAMIISIQRYAEQWLLWIIVNIITIAMWSYNFFITSGEDGATLVMWIVYLINAVISYIKWHNETKQIKGENNEKKFRI